MTVSELIEVLQGMSPHAEVTVPIVLTHETLGGIPHATVTSAFEGFDWDSGYVHLKCDKSLVSFNEDQFKTFQLMKLDASRVRSINYKELSKLNMSYEEIMAANTETGIHPLFKIKRN